MLACQSKSLPGCHNSCFDNIIKVHLQHIRALQHAFAMTVSKLSLVIVLLLQPADHSDDSVPPSLHVQVPFAVAWHAVAAAGAGSMAWHAVAAAGAGSAAAPVTV